ncbi:MAG: hypothetical protein RBT34_10590 [Anaerolineaceae bacterium]|jgi:hypothetical protein|nr:hypothetical protein [Anaerolineaceae bacterium]
MMTNTKENKTSDTTTPPAPYSRRRVRAGLTITLVGFVIFLIGARPAIFGLDRSAVIGFVQIAVYTIGLALICLGGYISLMAVWKGKVPSLAAEIGLRLVSTGYVVAVFSSMADIFGLGSHLLPNIPYFGPIQAAGVVIGETVILIGFLMLIPQPRTPKKKKVQKKPKIIIDNDN